MTTFNDVLNNAAIPRVWLVEITCYNPDTPGEETLRLGSRGFITASTDTPASTYYEERGMESFKYSKSMRDSTGRIHGENDIDRGQLVFDNSDGFFDSYEDYGFDGRDVVVKLGATDMNYDDFGTIFTGIVAQVGFSRQKFTVKLGGKELKFALTPALDTSKYDGTGGKLGEVETAFKPGPACYGICINAKPLLLDEGNQIYQVHAYGAIDRFTQFYDSGVPLSNTQSTSSPSDGTVTLSITPNGELTCDVIGHDDGTNYVSTVASTIQQIILNHTDLTLSSISTTSIANVAGSAPGVIGYYAIEGEEGTEDITRLAKAKKRLNRVKDMIDELCDGHSLFYTFNNSGKFVLGRLGGPGTSVLTLEEDLNIISLEQEVVEIPTYRHRCSYYRVWTLQSDSDLASSVSQAERLRLSTQYKLTESEDTSVQDKHLLAVDRDVVESFFNYEGGAQDEADRLQQMFGKDRRRFRVVTNAIAFQCELNDTITIKHSRFGLSAGADFRIVSKKIDANSLTTELLVWG